MAETTAETAGNNQETAETIQTSTETSEAETTPTDASEANRESEAKDETKTATDESTETTDANDEPQPVSERNPMIESSTADDFPQTDDGDLLKIGDFAEGKVENSEAEASELEIAADAGETVEKKTDETKKRISD